MANKARNTSGKFAPKSETPRKVRSVNLTDETWNRLAAVAEKTGKSRNDFLESLLQGNNPFIETVNFQPLPLIETVEVEIKTDDSNTAQQPDNEICPFMETVEIALEPHKQEADAWAEYNALLESSTHITNKLREEVAQLRSQLETERGDREEIERELSELKQNSVPAATFSEKLTPDAATILSKLRAKRKKSKVELADVEAILGMMEG